MYVHMYCTHIHYCLLRRIHLCIILDYAFKNLHIRHLYITDIIIIIIFLISVSVHAVPCI